MGLYCINYGMSAKTYNMLANGLASLHFLWTLFLIIGFIAMIFYPYPPYAIIQIVAISFTLLIAVPFRNTCPLTLLEERLRKKINPSYRNHGSFIATYINKFFNTRITLSQVNITIGILYFLDYCIAIFILVR
jgi:hypothetical protein